MLSKKGQAYTNRFKKMMGRIGGQFKLENITVSETGSRLPPIAPRPLPADAPFLRSAWPSRSRAAPEQCLSRAPWPNAATQASRAR